MKTETLRDELLKDTDSFIEEYRSTDHGQEVYSHYHYDAMVEFAIRSIKKYASQGTKEDVESLRDKFYDECVDNELEVTNGITHDRGVRINLHPHNLFEWFKTHLKPEGTKEEGWVIVKPDGNELWNTFEEGEKTCIKNFINHYSWFDWAWKQIQGYKCVRAERVTKLIEG